LAFVIGMLSPIIVPPRACTLFHRRGQVLKDLKKEKADKKKLDAQKKKIDDFTTKMKLAEKLAGVALGTSRLNYIDPRITLAWCKEAQFDFKRLFPKTQQVRVPARCGVWHPPLLSFASSARAVALRASAFFVVLLS
jgi:hypothetical protein